MGRLALAAGVAGLVIESWNTGVVIRWGTGGAIALPNLGLASQIFQHIGRRCKRSVLWPSKYAKMRFRPGLHLGLCWGDHDAPTNPLVGWGGDKILPHSVLATKTRRRRRLGL